MMRMAKTKLALFCDGADGNGPAPIVCNEHRHKSVFFAERAKKTRLTTSRHENTQFLEEYTLSVT